MKKMAILCLIFLGFGLPLAQADYVITIDPEGFWSIEDFSPSSIPDSPGSWQVCTVNCGTSDSNAGNSPYQGPIGSSNPGNGAQGNAAFDAARREAYRRSQIDSYRSAMKSIREQTRNWARQKMQSEQMTTEELNKKTKDLVSKLMKTLPRIEDQALLSSDFRRRVNPLPQASNQASMDRAMDKVWQSIEENKLLKISSAVNGLLTSNVPEESLPEDIYEDQVANYNYFETELILSKVLDEQGLLNVPFVENYQIPLKSVSRSAGGRRVRNLFNQHRANSSEVNAYCNSESSDENFCREFKESVSLTDFALYAFDSVMGRSAQGGSQELVAMETILRHQIVFTSSFVEAGFTAVSDLASAVYNYRETYKAIAFAVANSDKVWDGLVKGVEESWEDFKGGDSIERSKILGSVGFEVAALFVPASKAGAVVKMAERSRYFGGAMRVISKPLSDIHKVTRGVKGNVTKFLKSKVGRKWAEVRSVGQTIEKSGVQKFDTASSVNNAFPENGWYARVVPKDAVEGIMDGTGRLGAKEATAVFVGAADDISGYVSGEALASRLSLYGDKAGTKLRDLSDEVVLKFKFKNTYDPNLTTPIQYLKTSGKEARLRGFVGAGKTRGHAREWIMDNKISLDDLIDLESIIVEEIF